MSFAGCSKVCLWTQIGIGSEFKISFLIMLSYVWKETSRLYPKFILSEDTTVYNHFLCCNNAKLHSQDRNGANLRKSISQHDQYRIYCIKTHEKIYKFNNWHLKIEFSSLKVNYYFNYKKIYMIFDLRKLIF